MKLDSANSEAYINYLPLHESISDLIQIGSAGLTLLGNVVAAPNGEYLMGALVDSVQGPWRKNKRFPQPQQKCEHTIKILSNLMVVQSMSCFDQFTSDLLSDLLEFSPSVRKMPAFAHTHIDMIAPGGDARRAGCCFNAAYQWCPVGARWRARNRLL